jgi:hypothetical protein
MTEQAYQCFEWRASQKEVKWGGSVLRVTGKCRILPGYSVELRRMSPQGINPRACVLVVQIHRPLWRRGHADTMTVKEIEYSETTGSVFDTVLIMPDGVEIPVQPS